MVMEFKDLPANEKLKALIEKVKSLPPMTKEQKDAQRKSWVIGEMMLEHPEMSREYVEEIYTKVVGEGG